MNSAIKVMYSVEMVIQAFRRWKVQADEIRIYDRIQFADKHNRDTIDQISGRQMEECCKYGPLTTA